MSLLMTRQPCMSRVISFVSEVKGTLGYFAAIEKSISSHSSYVCSDDVYKTSFSCMGIPSITYSCIETAGGHWYLLCIC